MLFLVSDLLWSVLCWILKGGLHQISGVLSLCSFLFLTNCSLLQTSCFGLYRFLAPSSQLRKLVELYLILLVPQPGTSKIVRWAIGKVHFAYFLSLRDRCPLLPDVQTWKLSFHIFCLVFFPGFFPLSFKEECKSNPSYSFHSVFARSRNLRSFTYSVSSVWNALPPDICVIDTLPSSFCLAVFIGW